MRGLAVIMAATLVVTACGDDGGSEGGGDLGELAEALADGLGVDRATGQCVAEALVDSLGEDTLREINETDREPTTEEAIAVANALGDCDVTQGDASGGGTASDSVSATAEVDGQTYELGDDDDICLFGDDGVSALLDNADGVLVTVEVGDVSVLGYDSASIQFSDRAWIGGSEEEPLSAQIDGNTVTVSGTFNDFSAGTQSEGTVTLTC